MGGLVGRFVRVQSVLRKRKILPRVEHGAVNTLGFALMRASLHLPEIPFEVLPR